jgi:aromatic-L-amino-acid decarboxylase
MEFPLEPTTAQMRTMTDAAEAFLEGFISRLSSAPASDMDNAMEVALSLKEAAPEHGTEFERLLEVLRASHSKGFETAGPGYLAFIPGGGLFAAAIADFLACALNRYVGVWSCAPPFAQIEATAIQWLADMFHYPPEARGIFTSGGSLSTFSALVTARTTLLPENFFSGTIYCTSQTHGCVLKAAMLAGFPRRNVRQIAVRTSHLSMDTEALRRLLKEDVVTGMQPFFLVANAGTTNTGAIDALGICADIAQEFKLWLHVDAAYGGFFQLTEHGQRLFRGIERSDSITLDPHKGMFLPYGTGCLLVRNGVALKNAHTIQAECLQDVAVDSEIPNFSDYSPELSRDFRGLRVWLPVKLYGIGAFRVALEEKLVLARKVYDALRGNFEVLAEPLLTVVAFRYIPRNGEDANDFNRLLLERINGSKRIFLSSTTVEGRFTLRVCVLSFRTHLDRIDEAIHIILSAPKDVESEGGKVEGLLPGEQAMSCSRVNK